MSAKSKETRFKKGQSGNPKGRPKGSRRKLSEAECQELANRVGITPLEHFLSIMRDPNAGFRQKLNAAKAAAPLMHRKMPLELEAEGSGPAISVSGLNDLTKQELSTLRTLLEKAGITEDPEASDAP